MKHQSLNIDVYSEDKILREIYCQKNPSNVLKEKSCQVLVIFTYRGSSVSVFCVRTGFSCVNYTIQPFCRNKHSCITESIILKAPYTSLLEACKKPISEIFHLIAIDIFIYICFGNLE